MIESLAAWTLTTAALLVLKTTLLLGATWGVAVIARRRAAAERHFIWLAGMLGVVLLPALAVSPIRWNVALPLPAETGDAIPPRSGESRDPAVRLQEIGEATPRATADFAAAPSHPAIVEHNENQVRARAESPPGEPLGSAPPDRVAPTLPPYWSGAILLLWLGVALALVVGLVAGHLQACARTRRAAAIRTHDLVTLCRRIERELGTGPVRMLVGDVSEMPKAGGFLRPWLMLPGDIAEWPRARQESVLRHEIAHVRRRDTLWEVVASVVCAMHWFNPLVWFAAGRLRAEREHACDDIVLLSGTAPSEYATDLLSVARRFRPVGRESLVAIGMARPSRLRSRLTAVLGERRRTMEAFSGRGPLIAAGGIPLLLMMGVVAPAAPAEPTEASGRLSGPVMIEPEAERDAAMSISEPDTTPVPAEPIEAGPGTLPDDAVPDRSELWYGEVDAALQERVSTTLSAAVDLERGYTGATAVRYQVTATLKRSEEAAPMVPARIVSVLRGSSFLERMNVGWGGGAREPQTLSASFTFPDAAALDAWRDSPEGRAFQSAVEEASVEGSVRTSRTIQPVR